MTSQRDERASALESAHFAPDAPVLRGRLMAAEELRARRVGMAGEGPPVFGDDLWQLTGGQSRRNVPPFTLIVDFRKLGDPVRRITVKEFLYARLNERVPGIKRTLPLQIARQEFNFVLAFLSYLDEEQAGMPLRAVTQEVLDAYRLHVGAGRSGRGAPIAAASVAAYLAAPVKLALCGSFLTHDRLEIVPWRGRTPYVVAGVVERGENSTPRIPEVVLGPYLRWALFYVQVAAADILAACEELARLERDARPGDSVARLQSWIESRKRAGRGVPSPHAADWRSGWINLQLVARLAGLPNGAYINRPDCRRLLEEAAATLGLEPGGMGTPVSTDPLTGRPWRPRFSPGELVVEKRMLQAACYIVCAYLSGMRDSEVQELRRGCHTVERSADGVILRHKLRGRTFKGHGAQGRSATWVVIEPVAEAVQVLERMHPHEHLFTSPGVHAYPRRGRDGDHTGGARLGPGIVKMLNGFRDHINATQSSAGEPVVPLHEGEPWHFTTYQFRRTLAWHIANQPFGTVAGMLQYQHVSVATFEGYVGTSPSGFRREVEAERRLAVLDDIVEDYKDHRTGVPATGPGAVRRNALFADVEARVGDGAGVVDDARLRAMLQNMARTLYPGFLNDCFYNEPTAACRQHADGGEGPLLPACQPGKCANSVITPSHVPAWRGAIAETKVYLRRKDLTANQRLALKDKRDEMENVIRTLES